MRSALPLGQHTRFVGYAAPRWITAEASWDTDFINGRMWREDVRGSGVVYDLAGLLGQHTFTRASLETYFGSGGVLADAANDVLAFDHNRSTLAALGALLNGARTNSVRNPRCEGASAGSPGTLPTNWVGGTQTGVTRTIVGTGVEDGIEYIDIQWSGSGGQSIFELQVSPAADTASSNGQMWTWSSFLRLIAGSLSGFGATELRVYEHGSSVLASTASISSMSSSALRSQRFAVTRTNSQASTTNQSARITITPPATAWSVTFRIGGGQLELGAFSSSLVRPPVSSPAASTRALDALTAAVAGWLNAAEGTAAPQYRCPQVAGTTPQCVFSIDDGTANNRITLWAKDASGNVMFEVVAGGVQQCAISGGAAVAGQSEKVAVSWKANQFALSRNGGTPVTDASGSIPTGLTTLRNGASSAGQHLFGTLARIPILPLAKTGSELQGLAA